MTNATYKSQPREYASWCAMRTRISWSKSKDWHLYGGRGITACARWSSFAVFFADMGPKPTPQHTLDRIDKDGNYEPSNCRWATRKEQSRNTSTNRVLTLGSETLPISAWAEKLGLSKDLIRHRLEAGWSAEGVLTVPPIRERERGTHGAFAPTSHKR